MATFWRVMVTPARLSEFLATLAFGDLRRINIVSTAFETIAKKKKEGSVSTCDQQCIMNCQDRNHS